MVASHSLCAHWSVVALRTTPPTPSPQTHLAVEEYHPSNRCGYDCECLRCGVGGEVGMMVAVAAEGEGGMQQASALLGCASDGVSCAGALPPDVVSLQEGSPL